MTIADVRLKLNEINRMRPHGKPKVYPNVIGLMILGLDVIRLNEDLTKYLNIDPYDSGLSTNDMCLKVYDENVTKLIKDNLNLNNLVTK